MIAEYGQFHTIIGQNIASGGIPFVPNETSIFLFRTKGIVWLFRLIMIQNVPYLHQQAVKKLSALYEGPKSARKDLKVAKSGRKWHKLPLSKSFQS
jgi:hypothetical protein